MQKQKTKRLLVVKRECICELLKSTNQLRPHLIPISATQNGTSVIKVYSIQTIPHTALLLRVINTFSRCGFAIKVFKKSKITRDRISTKLLILKQRANHSLITLHGTHNHGMLCLIHAARLM